jgi:hypothetical protein
MKKIITRTAMAMFGFVLGGLLMLATTTESFAQAAYTANDIIGRAKVDAHAMFVQAAFIVVKMTGTNSLNAGMDIKGVPGEQAVMTCAVETGGASSSEPVKTRDCSGSVETVSHELVGKQHFDKEIELGDDVLSGAQGPSASSLDIDVTYN